MERFKKILIIIRRSNGDVFLTEPLIRILKEHYSAKVDLLINADTMAIAKLNPLIDNIYTYDYQWKGLEKHINEIKLFKKIFKQYDLTINLTANDRSVKYAIFGAKKSISIIDNEINKNWWKKLFLSHSYYAKDKHIVLQNLTPLQFLNIQPQKIEVKSYYNKELISPLKEKFPFLNKQFIIFHPSAQYDYKIYPQNLREELLTKLNRLDIPIVVTGGVSQIDLDISQSLPKLKNLHNLIAKTSLEEFIAISDLSIAYIGADTLNMHISASQNKHIFAIFGPSLHKIWSPWSNKNSTYAKNSELSQNYDNIHIFQATMSCIPCGLAGCDDRGGESECLFNISPENIYQKVKNALKIGN